MPARCLHLPLPSPPQTNQAFLDAVIGTVDEHPLFPVPQQMRDLPAWRARCAQRRAAAAGQGRAPMPVLPHNVA
jgi:hypothetical protein